MAKINVSDVVQEMIGQLHSVFRGAIAKAEIIYKLRNSLKHNGLGGDSGVPSPFLAHAGDCHHRKELTSGSTWYAAGLLPLFNLSYSVGQIHKYSVAVYQTLEKETGLDPGLRQVSNIRLARTRDQMDEYNYYTGVAETIGVKVKFLTPNQVKGDLAALQC